MRSDLIITFRRLTRYVSSVQATSALAALRVAKQPVGFAKVLLSFKSINSNQTVCL